MGAESFDYTIEGKDSKSAYESDVKEALYECGHNPYNGTISTTSGFVEVVLPEGTLDEYDSRVHEKISEILDTYNNSYEITKWKNAGLIEVKSKSTSPGMKTYRVFGWAAC